jgi:lipopolysaccharide export system permease protein
MNNLWFLRSWIVYLPPAFTEGDKSRISLSTLSRYLLREHLGPFALALTLIIFVLVIDVVLQMMDQVLSKGLSASVAVQLFVYNLAWIVALAVPMAVLVAVIMAFARFSADNEIMAAKACGISFAHLLRPVLLGAGALMLVMILFNDWVLPDWNHRARNITSSLKRLKAALVLKEKEGVFIHKLGNRYSLLIRDVDEERNTLRGITVYDAGKKGPPTTLHAAAGRIEIFGDGSYVKLTLDKGEYHTVDSKNSARFVRGYFDRQVIHIEDSQRAFSDRSSAYRGQREMNIAALYAAVEKRRAEQVRGLQLIDSTAQRQRSITASSETPLPDSTAASLASESQTLAKRLQQQQRLARSRAKQIDEFMVEIHKKFSIPAACLVFVLVGAPLGVLIRQRGATVSVGVSLVFFLVYWMFLIGGEELADRGFMPPVVAMWAPNLVFGLVGLFLVRAATLDLAVLQWRRRSSQS